VLGLQGGDRAHLWEKSGSQDKPAELRFIPERLGAKSVDLCEYSSRVRDPLRHVCIGVAANFRYGLRERAFGAAIALLTGGKISFVIA
jgi:hypothetical protein